jgi:DNA-binding transcriptional MerR regulator
LKSSQGKGSSNLKNLNQQSSDDSGSLPDITNKRYFTISEAAELCGVKPHVLRYWEQEFSQLKPSKRTGNRRYYQQKDILMIRDIRSLLYERGFTIEGAKSQLSHNRSKIDLSDKNSDLIKKMIADLENLLQNLRATKI